MLGEVPKTLEPLEPSGPPEPLPPEPPKPPEPNPDEKYNYYKDQCIKLLNNLTKSCPPSPSPKSKDNVDPHPEQGSKKTAPDKSSTFLMHNGKVGDLSELLLYLIKAPTTKETKFKLNKVYKIFNPDARDIVEESTIPTPTPVPVPVPGPAPVPAPVPAPGSNS